jgi:hypothetical protein
MVSSQITLAKTSYVKKRLVMLRSLKVRLAVALTLSLLVLVMAAAAAPAAAAAEPPTDEVPVTVVETDDSAVDGNELITPYGVDRIGIDIGNPNTAKISEAIRTARVKGKGLAEIRATLGDPGNGLTG